jgi:hypothetical protein
MLPMDDGKRILLSNNARVYPFKEVLVRSRRYF